ncbi:MAG: hypothetical protein EBT12_14905 [Marivivens sp.]|nr:hypothetical protein [Marivivens sp.]
MKPFGLQPNCRVKVKIGKTNTWPWTVTAGDEEYQFDAEKHAPFYEALKHLNPVKGDLIEVGVDVKDDTPHYRARLVSRHIAEAGTHEEAQQIFDAQVRHFKRCWSTARGVLNDFGEDASDEAIRQIACELFRAGAHKLNLRLMTGDPQDLPF